MRVFREKEGIAVLCMYSKETRQTNGIRYCKLSTKAKDVNAKSKAKSNKKSVIPQKKCIYYLSTINENFQGTFFFIPNGHFPLSLKRKVQ